MARIVVEGLLKGYRAANAYLIAQGVMPEIDLKNFVKRAPGGPTTGSMGLGGSFVGEAATGSASTPGDLGQRGGTTGGIHAPPGSFAPAAIGVAGSTGRGGATGGSPLLAARQRAQGVLVNLKRFVSGRIGSEFGQRQVVGGAAGAGGDMGGRSAE